MATTGMCWDDGWRPPPPREGDILIRVVAEQGAQTGAITGADCQRIRDAAQAADMLWMSDLLEEAGKDWLPWHLLPEWAEWIQPLRCAWDRRAEAGMGRWWHRAAGRGDWVWGEGIRVGGLVRRRRSQQGEEARGMELGWVRGMNRVGAEAGVWVDWGRGKWCCKEGGTCNACGSLRGRGKRWVGSFQHHHRAEHDWTDPRDIVRVWGGECTAPLGDAPSRLIVWLPPGVREGRDMPHCPGEVGTRTRWVHQEARGRPSGADWCRTLPVREAEWWRGGETDLEISPRARLQTQLARGGGLVVVSDGSAHIGGTLAEDRMSCGWVFGAALPDKGDGGGTGGYALGGDELKDFVFRGGSCRGPGGLPGDNGVCHGRGGQGPDPPLVR